MPVARYIGQPRADTRDSPPIVAPTPTLPRARRKGGSRSFPCLRGKSLPPARTGGWDGGDDSFDVPIFKDGSLGAPIPTFERLENLTPTKPTRTAGNLSEQQERFKLEEAALENVLAKGPTTTLQVMNDVITAQKAKEFDQARSTVQAAAATPQQADVVQSAANTFRDAAVSYVAQGGDTGMRYEQFSEALAKAYSNTSAARRACMPCDQVSTRLSGMPSSNALTAASRARAILLPSALDFFIKRKSSVPNTTTETSTSLKTKR